MTLRDLQSLQSVAPRAAMVADRLLVETYEQFVAVLERDIERLVKMMEEDPGVREKSGEDLLSTEIMIGLRVAGYIATRDEKVGGHSDIVVRDERGYLWLGEAKIHSDYGYLEKGFNQLTTRYSTGAPGCDCGGLLIYIRTNDAANVVTEWRKHLSGLSLIEYSDEDCSARGSLGFLSTHKHDRSGRAYRVRHIGVVLGFHPKDRPANARRRTSMKASAADSTSTSAPRPRKPKTLAATGLGSESALRRKSQKS